MEGQWCASLAWITKQNGVIASGVAVDRAGKIYVADTDDTVTTYNADGTPSTPTITITKPDGYAKIRPKIIVR